MSGRDDTPPLPSAGPRQPQGISPAVEPYEQHEELIREVRARQGPRHRFYVVSETMVVLGLGSRAELEVHAEVCGRDGVPLRRRRGGGCSVVLGPGNAIVDILLPSDRLSDSQPIFERMNRWLIDALEELGVGGVRQAGISDLAVDDRKVGGSCIYRARGLLLYSASLLVDADLRLIERYLRHPPREPAYRRGRGHGDFLMCLAELAPTLSAGDLVLRLGELELPDAADLETTGRELELGGVESG